MVDLAAGDVSLHPREVAARATPGGPPCGPGAPIAGTLLTLPGLAKRPRVQDRGHQSLGDEANDRPLLADGVKRIRTVEGVQLGILRQMAPVSVRCQKRLRRERERNGGPALGRVCGQVACGVD
jgi:hypothetical protein